MSSWNIMNPSSMSMFHMGQLWHHQQLAKGDRDSDTDVSDTESDHGDFNSSISDFNDSFLSVDDLDDSSSTEDEVDGHFLFNPGPSEFGAKGNGRKIPQGKGIIYENGGGNPQNAKQLPQGLRDEDRLNWLLRGQHLHYNATGPPPPISLPGTKSSISNDSLAFTLVYCSVFTLTLLYIAFKISMKWRNNRQSTSTPRPTAVSESQCNHAACQEVRNSESILPYSGLGAIWIPEIMNIQTPSASNPPAVHNSRLCNNRCDRCRQLAQPPPSYSKLFLEENPPTYTDAVLVMECSGTAENCQLDSCKLHQAASSSQTSCTSIPSSDGATAPLITIDRPMECSGAASTPATAPLIFIDQPATAATRNAPAHPLDISHDSSLENPRK